VFCWGGNGKGQLGNNSTSTNLVPFQVQGLEANIATLGVGSYHGCAANPNGTSGINCWGDNEYGQLGIGSFAATLIALPNAILTNSPGLISAGGGHTCALYHPMGDLRCWGDNEFGQLGNSSHVNSTYAVQIQQVQVGTQDLATGAGHTCALTQNNIQCWGDNQYGQLGSGSTISVAAPIPVQFQ